MPADALRMSLARLTQLFAEGTELVLDAPSGEKIVVWIAKLNSFEEEQANQEGRVARARLVNAIREVGTPEFDVVRASKADALDSAMVYAISQGKESELFIKAVNSIRSDVEWRERLEIMDFSDNPEALPPVEKEAVEKLTTEYNEALLGLHESYMEDLRHDLRQMSRKDLEEQFEQAYLSQQGLSAFAMERGRQHTYLAMRTCVAAPPGEGSWDHSKCDHQRFFLAYVAEVDQLPQSVRDQVDQAYTAITMAPSLARFTDALASSSASPEPAAKEADSTPSGPEATSSVPGTTSSLR